jgi:hypothetical protein
MIKNGYLIGLASFVVLSRFRSGINLGIKAGKHPAPELTEVPKKPRQLKSVSAQGRYMKAEHMQLLDVWRDTVVRNAERILSTRRKDL